MSESENNDPYVLISADCHAGARISGYREFLDPAYRERFDLWREQCAAFVKEQMGDEPPIVIGHSFGSLIALELAAELADADPAPSGGAHLQTLGWHAREPPPLGARRRSPGGAPTAAPAPPRATARRATGLWGPT